MDKKLEELKKQYDEVAAVNDWYIVKKGNSCGVVKFDAGWKQEIIFDGVESISKYGTHPRWKDNLFCVQKNGKWGYVNNEGKEIIPCSYDYCAVPREVVGDSLLILNSDGFDYVDEDNVTGYADDENFYRVIMYSLKNRYNIVTETRNKKSIEDFVEDARYKINMIVDSIKKSETRSKISKVGVSALLDFYNENLVVSELSL